MVEWTKSELVRSLTTYLPLNSFQLPTGIWRPDLLPNEAPSTVVSEAGSASTLTSESSPLDDAAKGQQLQVVGPSDNVLLEATPLGLDKQLLDAAWVPLDYSEGFPSLPSGFPFWTQFEFEPLEDYWLFEQYLQAARKGVRTLHELSNLNLNGLPIEIERLKESFGLYYWPLRAKAFDMFSHAARRREREAMIFDMEAEHLREAAELRTKCMEYINGSEFEEQLTPKVAIDLLRLTIQWQRISLGLPANGPPTVGAKDAASALPAGASLELILRQLVQRESSLGGNSPNSAIELGDSRIKHFQERILENPDLTSLAQELIIKLNTGNARDAA